LQSHCFLHSSSWAKSVLLLLISVSWNFSVFADEVTVSRNGAGDFTSIASAIAETADGDTILVIDSATYPEVFSVANRTIRSTPPGALITSTVTVTGNASSSTTIHGFTFTGTSDGIHFDGDGPDYSPQIGTLAVSDCEFIDLSGHGILLNLGNNGILDIKGTTFRTCGLNGLTLWRNSRVSVSDSVFELNGLSGTGDAGIFVDGDNNNALGRDITLTNVLFKNNLNGIKSWRRVRLDATETTVSENFIQGVWIDGSSGGSTVTLTNAAINGNVDRGITLYRGMTLNLNNCTVANNGTYGIFFEDFGSGPDFGFRPVISLKHSRILDNGNRGLNHLAKSNITSIITITDSLFTGTADRLFSAQAETGKNVYTLQRNIFRSLNTNAIPVWAWHSNYTSTMAANLIDGGLVGVALNEGAFSVYNNTIINSSAGGLVVSNNSGNFLANIRNNIVAQCGSGIRAAGDGTGFSAIVVDHNLVQTTGIGPAIDSTFNVGPSNNVTDPPGFVSGSVAVGTGNYHLSASSAARNAGDPDFTPISDLEGRSYNPTGPDLGAYTGVSVIDGWQLY